MTRVEGKVVLITGASAGIGEAIAREYVAAGARVALLARRTDKLEALCQELGGAQHAIAVTADVTKEGDLEAAVKRTVEAFGRLDVAIANAGFGVMGHFTKLSFSDYQRQFDTNIYGALRTAFATVPELRKSKGALAFIGSVSGYLPLPESSAYGISKAAVLSMAESLRVDLAPLDVSVTHVAPGFIKTDIRRMTNAGVVSDAVKDPVPLWLQMPAQTAARKIIRAIHARRRELVLTGHGKVGAFLGRHFSGFVSFVLAQVTKRTLKRLA